MTWLKRNLFLVVGGVVVFGLLGCVGFYLLTQNRKASGITGELERQITEFKRLTTRDPSAKQDNIDLAKQEQKRLLAALEETKKSFEPVAGYTNIDTPAFKALLQTTIFELKQTAEKEGVQTPPEPFSYTFRSQRGSVVFDAPDLLPWTYQLLEIKALCEAIYRARIHALVSLRRAPVSKKDVGATDYLYGRKPVTNAVTGAVSTPYEVTFQGFSGELAAVLENLLRSPHCFIVKNINVEKASAAAAADAESPGPGYYQPYTTSGEAPAETRPSSAAELMRRRYGINPGGGAALRDRYRLGPGPSPPPAPSPYTPPPAAGPVRRGPETVLDERQLRVTMLVDAVRLGALTK